MSRIIIEILQKFSEVYNIVYTIGFKKLAHNVPAVYDVLAARIRALRNKDQVRQNVAEVCRGNERSD
jgi:hypothetical protein